MDQKHAMLYPDPNAMPNDQRSSAAAAIGLPIEAPPSYDMATREFMPQPSQGWMASAPDINAGMRNYQTNPSMEQHLPVVVEQPRYPISPTLPGQNSASVYPNQPTVPTQQTTQPLPHVSAAAGVATTVHPTPALLNSSLGPNPSKVTCPACGASKISRMCYTPNSKTHLCAFILCLVGWCCCACIVPYCMNSCRTGNHYCAKCNAFLGAYQPKSSFR